MAHSYWRINITANNGDANFVGLAEIEMRATLGGVDQCTGGTVLFSSQYNTSTFAAINAFDDNIATGWVSATGGVVGYIGYQFATPVDVDAVLITFRAPTANAAEAPKNFTVQYSDNGSAWTTLFTVSNQTGWANSETRTFICPVLSLIPQGTLTLTGNTPSFLDGYSDFTVPQGVLTLTGNAPSFDDGNTQVAAIPQGVLTLTGNIPAFTVAPPIAEITVDIVGVSALDAYIAPVIVDVVSESELLAYQAIQVAVVSESELPAYQTTQAPINSQSTLSAYEATASAIHSQSALAVYQTAQASVVGQAALASYTAATQVELIAQSGLLAYVPTRVNVSAQSDIPIYADYKTVTFAQAQLKAYEPFAVNVIGQSSVLNYWTAQVAVNAQSTLNAAYNEAVVSITGQARLNAYETKRVEVVGQSALTVYQTAVVAIFAASALAADYSTTRVNVTGQSALTVYADTLTSTVAQSALNIYEVTLVEINAQSALLATEKYYAWAMNLNTGTVSKFDNYNFNSLSGNMGANESGIFTLSGNTDASAPLGTGASAPITGLVGTGKMALNAEGLSRVTDAYIGLKGGAVKLTLTTENTGAIPYTTGVTSQMMTAKLNLAKGAKGKYWTARLENVAGSTAQIDEVTLLVDNLSRRI